jgi:PAS domain S-box-containing protein
VRNWFASSITHRFAATATAIAVLTGLALGAASYLVMRAQILENINFRLEAIAELTARRAELILVNSQGEFVRLALNPLVPNALVDSTGRELYLRPLLHAYRELHPGFDIGLYDFQARPYIVDAGALPAASGEPAVRSALAGVQSARIEAGAVIVALPVVFPATTQAEGALVARVPLEAVLRRATAQVDKNLEVAFAVQAAAANASRLTLERPLELPEPLNGLGLIIRVSTDEYTAFAPLRSLARTYALIGLGSAVAVFFFVLIASRRVARPLVGLSRAAQAVAGDGRLDHPFAVEGKDEVAGLARSLGHMLSRLEESHRELETRVADRTRDLKAKGQELRLQASRLSAVLENIVDGIVTIDSGGTMLSVNPAAERLFGWRAEDMVGRNVSMLMPEPHRSAHEGYIARYLATGESRVVGVGRQLFGQRSDGRLFPFELSVSVIRSERPIFISVVRDISDRLAAQEAMRKAKETAEAANEAKSDFMATITHELRTPMNGALGMLDLLLRGELSPEQRRKAEIAHRSARSLLTLINDILDFSKLEAGGVVLEDADFELEPLVAEAMDVLEPMAQEKGLALEMTLAPELPAWLKGDRARLLQVLLNLAFNAIKFTDAGHVTIRVSRLGQSVRFEVEDSGSGIAPGDLQRLFTRFTQLEGSYTRKHGGTGLGLVISRRLVTAMGGEIGVSSEPGSGSNFWFTIPLAEGRARAERRSQAGRDWRLSGRILLAEDSETNRLVATSLLERTGLVVDCVENGRAAVEAVVTGGYDLVLMDVAMPEMNGLSATRAIRALPEPVASVPIVAMTAFAMAGDAEKCLAAGMNDYISKPFEPAALYTRIAHWLDEGRGTRTDDGEQLDDASIRRIEAATDLETTRRIAGKISGEIENRAARLNAAVRGGDVATVAREAHTLKGLAATMGAEELRTLATTLENRGHAAGEVADEASRLEEVAGKTVAALRKRFLL